MSSKDEKDPRVVCPMCNTVCIQIVPYYDDDQAHKKTMCCRDCKKKLKNGEKIVKFKRNPEEIKNLERNRR